MRCISLRQPWAWATCAGKKTIENRAASTDYRGMLAIHASSNREDLRPVLARYRQFGLSESDFAYGAVIGTVELADCAALSQELEGDPWASGPFCWRLRNARLLPDPVPTCARASLFTLPLDITQRVQAQLDQAQTAPASAVVERTLGDIRPTPLGAELARGSSYVALNQPLDVVRVATGILDQQPDCGRAYQLRAIGLAATGQRLQAIDDVERAISHEWLEVDDALARRGNMAALYHAAECCARAADEAAQRRVRDYHEQLALLVNVSEPDRTLAARSYDAYRRFAPADAIRAYAKSGSASDHPERLIRLVTDASAAGLEAAEIDHLRIAALAAQLTHSRQAVMHVTAALQQWFA